ncbi:MAG: SDR family NAD(P)-dependent oxidoreductase [Firmicutes bacterium]|nr:SDR family NAD(P)-dependent oxidoreductase [Bacillota bacterium]
MKIAVITGASSGMGKEFVYAVDREYELDEIWVIDRNGEKLETLRSECRNSLRTLPWDLSDKSRFEEYRKMLEEQKPEIRLLINDAGYGLFGPFETLDLDETLGIMDVNDKALTAFCMISLPYMKKGDSIINMGSNSSWQPVPYQAVYGASKAYVLSFSRAIGRELKSRGIHVMCVCPGWIKTDFQERAKHDEVIKYVDRWYTAKEVIDQAMIDLKKKKKVSILGAPVRRQVRLVKHLPVDLIMNIWCKQQGIE